MLAAAGLAACGGTPGALVAGRADDAAVARAAATATPAWSRVWILNGPGLEAQDMATNPNGIAFLANPARLVLYPAIANAPAPASWNVLTWEKFNSLSDFEKATDLGDVAAVAYDNEGGQLNGQPWTNPAEWQRCASTCSGVVDANVIEASMIKFANLARKRRKLVIFMPAADLWSTMPGNNYTNYEKSGVAAVVAQYADFYHIQAQGLEPTNASPSTTSYTTFVRTIQQQVEAASPRTVVTAGITTIVDTNSPSSAENIADAVKATSAIVAGYWPNDVGAENAILNGAIARLMTASPAP